MSSDLFPVQILDPAQSELEEIAHLYMALAGPDSARKITDKIFEAMDRLSSFPLSGPCIRDKELRVFGYRYVVVDKYIVIYRFINRTVVIYHIFDGRSDYPALFRSELFR